MRRPWRVDPADRHRRRPAPAADAAPRQGLRHEGPFQMDQGGAEKPKQCFIVKKYTVTQLVGHIGLGTAFLELATRVYYLPGLELARKQSPNRYDRLTVSRCRKVAHPPPKSDFK